MMSPAQKAVRTTKARRALAKKYSDTTFNVLVDLCQNVNDEDIMDFNGIDTSKLAAYKANLTRGTYDAALRNCNF